MEWIVKEFEVVVRRGYSVGWSSVHVGGGEGLME